MKRELKFRVWDNENKKFFKPTYEAYKGKLLDLSITLSGKLLMRTLNDPAINESVFPNRFIISQYTGIKTVNKSEIYDESKEIYEGDIYTQGDSKTKYLVTYVDGGFIGVSNEDDEYGYYTSQIKSNRKTIVIIGNIFETPSLMDV